MKALNITRKIDPKLTNKDWQLYCDMTGSKTAARVLNKALKLLVNTPNSTPNSVVTGMQVVMRTQCRFGADDTEPHYVLDDIIRVVYPRTINDYL